MHPKTLSPFILLIGMTLMVGLACTLSGTPSADTPTPAPTDTPLPSPTPLPTATRAQPTARPTATPIPRFFTEEFETQSSLWDYFVVGPGSDYSSLLNITYTNHALRVEIRAQDLYYYHFYTAQTYDDVRLEMNATNLGVNSQNVSLVCRLSDDGWYEFSVGSDGAWYLYTYVAGRGYLTTANGGTTALQQGHATNDYGMLCIGNLIHLYVNGQELRNSPVRVTENLPAGQVGFNISSLWVTPVIVDVNRFQISPP